MRKHNWRNLILLVLLMISLIPVYYVIQYNRQMDDAAQEEDTAQQVMDITFSDLTQVSFEMDGSTVSFEKEDDSWTVPDDKDFKVDASKLETTITSITGMTSDRVLEEVKDLSEYGLDAPSQTVTMVTAEGVTYHVYFGATNDSTGNVYAYLGDDKTTVYTVSSSAASAFSGTLEDYRATEEDTSEQKDASEEKEADE